MDEFRLCIFKHSFIFFGPLNSDVGGFIKDDDILERGLARRAEVGVVDKAIPPTDEHADSFETTKEPVYGDEEDNYRQC
jgi:hypothetical protein